MTLASGDPVLGADGRRLFLGPLIKSGGAGSVYVMGGIGMGASGQVAKIYHAGADLVRYERKLNAMLSLSPELPEMFERGQRYVQIAWPQELLRDVRGRFAGF